MDKTFIVDGMSCKHCAMRVEKALKEIGAKDVKVNLASKEVRILSSQELQDNAILEAIADAGYTVLK